MATLTLSQDNFDRVCAEIEGELCESLKKIDDNKAKNIEWYKKVEAELLAHRTKHDEQQQA